MMTTSKKFYLNVEQYQALYKHSVENPNEFWGIQAKKFITWFAQWHTVKNGNFATMDIEWFVGGQLNACYNCLDRHLAQRKNQIAIIWEGDEPTNIRQITYHELYNEVCRFANVLKNQGIKSGERVCIYLPMIPEAIVAMLACARIGAIHSVIFAGFSAEALKSRILDADAKLIVTADEGIRGGKLIPLKNNVDLALNSCPQVHTTIVIAHTGNPIPWNQQRDKWYHAEMAEVSPDCPPTVMDANDPLFILYTSGSTGTPKGIVHNIGGYLVYVATTYHYIFNYHAGDIYWCTADIGWITGHSYLVYGPLMDGATTVMYEGIPSYPTFARFWEIIDRHQINIFYTAPTVIRTLRHAGNEWVKRTSRASLTLLGTVGEPINPEVWAWYDQIVGNQRCPIVDTWWQTETGGILISPLPGVTPLKPGAAAWPFFGIEPAIIDDHGQYIMDDTPGKLVIKQPWPGLMRSIFGNHQRFIETYFTSVPGNYLTGDDARRDPDGYFWITGRSDEVIKVSGHRLGTGELESAFISHPAVSEAAVVSIPHTLKGHAIYAYITTKAGIEHTENLRIELINHIRRIISPIATPEVIQWADDLPKTRSGKIMRRILRKIANNELENIGDTSTLANPTIVANLIAARKMIKLDDYND